MKKKYKTNPIINTFGPEFVRDKNKSDLNFLIP